VLGGLFAWVALAWLYGYYTQDELRMAHSTADDVPGLVLLAAATTWAGQLADAALDVKEPPISKLAVFFVALVILATFMRAIARTVVRRWLMPTEPTLVVGTGRIARRVVEKLAARPEYGIRVVGFVDDDPTFHRRRIQGVPVVSSLDEIGWTLGRLSPDTVLVTIPEADRERLDGIVEACKRADVQCRFVRRHIDLDPSTVLGATAE
jgi:FlaA1/EpsC-like NDP-sugar epimerase